MTNNNNNTNNTNSIIRHIRTNLPRGEKAKMTTEMLRGFTGDGWATKVLQTVYGDEHRADMGKLQMMKHNVFDLLAAKFEGEK